MCQSTGSGSSGALWNGWALSLIHILYSSIPLKNEPILLTEEQQAAYNALLPGLELSLIHI